MAEKLIDIGEVCTHDYYNRFKDEAFPAFLMGYKLIPTTDSVTESPKRYIGDEVEIDVSQKYLVVPIPINPRGGVDVNIQDQTTRPVLNQFCRALEAPRAIVSATVPNTYTIELDSAVGLLPGNTIGLFQNSTNPASFIADIISISSNTLTMDTPLDIIFDPALNPVIFKIECQMNVLGSLVAPVMFEFANGSDIDVDLTRIIFTVVSTGLAEYTDFGDIPLLTNGVVLRKRNADGTYFNIANIKANGQWKAIMYDVDFFDADHPLSVNGVSGRLTFAGQNKIGVAIRIAKGEAVELVVQDDLRTLVAFIIFGEGHYVDEV